MIKIISANKIYDKNIHALVDININIDDGEFLVIVGPSGCGKTTLLRCIAGLEKLSSGDIVIDGKVVTNAEPKERNMAMVFQNYALYPHMSVRDNLAFALRGKLSRAEIKARIEKVATTLDIVQLLNRKPPTLSGGQSQRVALGRAMVRNPKILLLDEPLSNLDAQIIVKTRLELLRLHRSLGSTFICVTHDQEEAMMIGSRIAVMNNGGIQQIGTPEEVYNFPDNLFVAKFIGEPQINLLFFDIVPDIEKITLKNNSIIYNLTNLKIIEYFRNHPKISSIIVGIRLERIQIIESPKQMMENMYYGKISEIVRLGREMLIYISCNNLTIITTASSNSDYCIGESIAFFFDEVSMLFFDKRTNKRIRIMDNKNVPCWFEK